MDIMYNVHIKQYTEQLVFDILLQSNWYNEVIIVLVLSMQIISQRKRQNLICYVVSKGLD